MKKVESEDRSRVPRRGNPIVFRCQVPETDRSKNLLEQDFDPPTVTAVHALTVEVLQYYGCDTLLQTGSMVQAALDCGGAGYCLWLYLTCSRKVGSLYLFVLSSFFRPGELSGREGK